MSASPLPWEKYAPPQAGPWEKYGGGDSAASPIAPPPIEKPAVAMHRSFLVGDPNKDVDSTAVQMEPITDFGKGIASASAPVIGHRVLQQVAPRIAPPGNLYEGETSLHDLPEAAGKTFAGAMVGPLAGEPLAGEAQPITRSTEVPARIAPPTPESGGPGMLGRVGEVALRRAGRIPGVQALKDANYIFRGSAEAPAAPIAEPGPLPIPETNGIQWGSGGKGPLDLRGQRIQTPPPIAGQAGSMAQSVVEPAPQPAVDPILSRLRANASRIAEEGHGDEESALPEEATPVTTNLNDDLTPALKASLRKVRAAKGRIARAN